MNQFDRVVAITKGHRWLTLRSIENACRELYGEYDTQSAISARLRESSRLALLGLKKERWQQTTPNGKQLHMYRVTKL